MPYVHVFNFIKYKLGKELLRMHQAKTKTKTNKQKRMHRLDTSILWNDWHLPLSRQPAHGQGSNTKPSRKNYQKTQKVSSLGLSRTTYSVAGRQCLWETELGNMTWEWQVRDVCAHGTTPVKTAPGKTRSKSHHSSFPLFLFLLVPAPLPTMHPRENERKGSMAWLRKQPLPDSLW